MLDIALLEGTLAVPAPAVATASLRLPANQTLCGVRIYCQFAHVDPGASHGFAFSPGLRLLLGN